MKNYNISSNNLQDPLLKPLLEKLTEFFDSISTRFYVIGATARDIMLQAHDMKSGRRTHDLDVAIAIPDWSLYQEIEEKLVKTEGFKKDTNQRQKFIHQGIFELDIVPYGDIMKEQDKIFWPPDEGFAMSVLGFPEVDKAASEVTIDNNLKVNVASLAGVFLLKITAWIDRNLEFNKDAEDMGFILNNYFSINESRILENYLDFYDDPEFTMNTAGAKLLGKDLAQILKNSPETKAKYISILESEFEKKDDSRLLNQIIETNRIFNYPELQKCLEIIINELKNG